MVALLQDTYPSYVETMPEGRIVRETLKRGPVDATATGAGVPV